MNETKTKRCPCCGGTGVQYSQTRGLRVLCPACHGSGEIKMPDKITW